MTYKTVEVEVDVDLEDFDTADLLDELASRDVIYTGSSADIINEIIKCKYRGQPYDHLVDKLIYETTGKIV